MNERILELAEQAEKMVEHSWGDPNYRDDDYYIAFDEWQKKFAELIIRECCDILTDNVEVALNASGSPVYPEGLIREHFGVEE